MARQFGSALLAGGLGALAVLGPADEAATCVGTPRDPCAQTAYLAKTAPRVVAHPGPGEAVVLPVGLGPFVQWGSDPDRCAQPSTARLTLTAVCTPEGGSPVTIGPFDVPVDTPASQGLQPVLTGAGGQPVIGGEFPFTIPAGTLPADRDSRCLIRGVYEVGFAGGGGGSGIVTAVGDVEVCVVADAAEGDASVPAFNAYVLNPADGTTLHRVRPGDQGRVSFVVENNTDEPMAVALTGWARTVSRMPAGTTAARYSISAPEPGTDAFAIAWSDELAPFEVLPLPDPRAADPEIRGERLLAPHEVAVVQMDVRPHAMCGPMSCDEIGLELAATSLAATSPRAPGKLDGPTRQVCVSVMVVADRDAPSYLRMAGIDDRIVQGHVSEGFSSPAQYDGDVHLTTHSVSNDSQAPAGLPVHTRGLLVVRPDFPVSLDDRILLLELPDRIDYHAQSRNVSDSFVADNFVTVEGLDALPGTGAEIRIPHLRRPGPTLGGLEVFFDAASGEFLVVEPKISNFRKRSLLFRGTESELAAAIATGEVDLRFEDSTFRVFVVDLDELSAPALDLPHALAGLVAGAEVVFSRVVLGPAGTLGFVPVSSDGGVAATRGPGPELQVRPEAVATSPHTTTGAVRLDFDDPGLSRFAIEAAGIPFAFRAAPANAPPVRPLTVDKGNLVQDFAKPGRDRLALGVRVALDVGVAFKRSAPIPEECRDLVVDVGGVARGLSLDERGRYRSADRRVTAKARAREGELLVTVKLRRSRLAGALADEGLVDETVPRAGESRTLRVRLAACGAVHAGDAELLWRATRGKRGKGKLVRR